MTTKVKKYTMEELETEITNYLMNEKIDYDHFGDDTYVHIIAHGFTYNISIYFDNDINVELSTIHLERLMKNENEDYKNNQTAKKLSTIFEYVEKYVI